MKKGRRRDGQIQGTTRREREREIEVLEVERRRRTDRQIGKGR